MQYQHLVLLGIHLLIYSNVLILLGQLTPHERLRTGNLENLHTTPGRTNVIRSETKFKVEHVYAHHPFTIVCFDDRTVRRHQRCDPRSFYRSDTSLRACTGPPVQLQERMDSVRTCIIYLRVIP
ncbi:hypothetical protein EDD16DRAFT_741729 [Pisolithus croceorrhizus]|nr:hypothetical protein EDD16DRAFT_741729 [Pisolithus croceorrhizus]KAI6105201.1 hypothetical protein EV401DRAFT_603314 [Pisolithus croceorrhizus]KAI6156228.1 hypothetical protein EDD17DRAFT_1054412 [Pisolithus thermaeus]